jgi:hypothetical protein
VPELDAAPPSLRGSTRRQGNDRSAGIRLGPHDQRHRERRRADDPRRDEGAVLHAKPDGTCLAEFAFTPQTADADGDFVQAVLTEGQYEIIQIWSSSCTQLGGAADEPGGDLSGS